MRQWFWHSVSECDAQTPVPKVSSQPRPTRLAPVQTTPPAMRGGVGAQYKVMPHSLHAEADVWQKLEGRSHTVHWSHVCAPSHLTGFNGSGPP